MQNPDLSFEIELWNSGILAVAGLDEAGRGAWAGPVAAAAVILPPDPSVLERLNGVRDSKQMTAKARARFAETIRSVAVAWGVGMAGHDEIDANGILPSTRLAMRRALDALQQPAQHLLIDAVRLPLVALPQTSLIKGDARVLSIAAASVLAKTARDTWMVEADSRYPGYGFARHKGYGVAAHRAALEAQGPCAIHRMSFEPLRSIQQSAVSDPLEGNQVDALMG